MQLDKPLKFGYALFALKGLLTIIAPRKAIGLATSVWRVGFENVGDLEPRGWYLRATRAVGVGMVAAGLTGLLLTAAGDDDSDNDNDDGTVDDESEEPGDGPIRVDVDR